MVRWVLLGVGLGACGTRGGSDPGTDSADPAAATEDPVPDRSVPDDVAYPKPSEWYTSAAIFESLARGEIREGQAALYLLQILGGGRR